VLKPSKQSSPVTITGELCFEGFNTFLITIIKKARELPSAFYSYLYIKAVVTEMTYEKEEKYYSVLPLCSPEFSPYFPRSIPFFLASVSHFSQIIFSLTKWYHFLTSLVHSHEGLSCKKQLGDSTHIHHQ
jgi:hypothetical protein